MARLYITFSVGGMVNTKKILLFPQSFYILVGRSLMAEKGVVKILGLSW